MERSFIVRGQVIVVEEVDDVWAIRVDQNQDPAAFGPSARDVVTDASGSASRDDVVAAFEDADWHFVIPRDAIRGRLDTRQPVPGIVDNGKVIIQPAGTIAVAPFRLNLKLLAQHSLAECQQILADNDLQILYELGFAPNLFHVETLGRDDAIAVAARLRGDADFLFAEPSLIEHVDGRYKPENEPEYPKQWQWNNTGQLAGPFNGISGADVRAEAAWDYTFGSGVTVAVIDHGFHVDHPDLAGAIAAASGYLDDSGVWQPGTAAIPPGVGHGTRCAAMVGARENGTGGIGGAPECDLLLIATGQPLMEQAGLAKAVGYAIDPTIEGGKAADRADILSVSLGPREGEWLLSETLAEALQSADSGRDGLGALIFWAACNKYVDSALDQVISHANVIAVVKSDNKDQKTGFSGNGAFGAAVELTAPGRSVWVPRGAGTEYMEFYGTSMATPCAAACAALALSVGRSLTREELRKVLRETAHKIGSITYTNGRNDDFGYGRVNAHNAVRMARLLDFFGRLKKAFGKKSGCAVFVVVAAALILFLILMV